MHRILLPQLIALMLLMSVSCSAQSPERLQRQIGDVSISGLNLAQLGWRLAGVAGLRYAIEVAPDDEFSYWESPSPARTLTLNIDLPPETTIAAALNEAVRQDPRYEWYLAGEWLHVVPRNRGLNGELNRPHQYTSPASKYFDRQIKSVFGGDLPEGWACQILFLGSVKRGKQVEISPLAQMSSVREALDVVLDRYGASSWNLRQLRNADGTLNQTVLEILI